MVCSCETATGPLPATVIVKLCEPLVLTPALAVPPLSLRDRVTVALPLLPGAGCLVEAAAQAGNLHPERGDLQAA